MNGNDPVGAALTFVGFCVLFLVLCVVTALMEKFDGRGAEIWGSVRTVSASAWSWTVTAIRRRVTSASEALSRLQPPTMPWRW